jgi:tetratricopeptide (TPR) repeat protein
LQKALELRRRLLGPDHPDVAQSLLDHSYNAFEKGNLVAAEVEARQALAICQKGNVKHEKTLSAFGLLVFFLVERRKAVEAQAVADQALAFARDAGYAENPEVAKILHDLVALRIRAGDLAGAEQLAIKAVAMHRRVNGNDHPETGWALLNRGDAFAAQGKHAEAETSFREALTIFRKHYVESHKSILFTSEALQRVLTNRNDKAGLVSFRADKVARLSKALELQEGNWSLRIHLGNVLRDAGDLDRALAQFSEVITRDPKRVDAWIARGDCYVRRGEFAKAAEDYSAAIKLKSDAWEAWSGRAFFHFNRQQWDRAISDYSKAIDLDPPVRTNWWHRGHAYLQLAQWDKAAADFGKVVDQWPDGSEGWYWRGVAFAQLNQPDKAIANLRQAIAIGFNDLEHMKNNPKLAPLRSREDFGKLMNELERKQKLQSKQSGP